MHDREIKLSRECSIACIYSHLSLRTNHHNGIILLCHGFSSILSSPYLQPSLILNIHVSLSENDPRLLPPHPLPMSRCRKTEVRPATSAVPQPAQSSPPFNVSPSVMFRLLAARMHSAHKAGKLDALRYSSVADSYVDDAHPMGGALSCDPFFASALQSIGVSHALSEVIFDDTVVPFLPFGWGLPLLLKFGRLYRIRCGRLEGRG